MLSNFADIVPNVGYRITELVFFQTLTSTSFKSPLLKQAILDLKSKVYLKKIVDRDVSVGTPSNRTVPAVELVLLQPMASISFAVCTRRSLGGDFQHYCSDVSW